MFREIPGRSHVDRVAEALNDCEPVSVGERDALIALLDNDPDPVDATARSGVTGAVRELRTVNLAFTPAADSQVGMPAHQQGRFFGDAHGVSGCRVPARALA